MAINLDQALAAGRIAVGFAGGIVTTLGINAIDPATLQEGFNHIFNGVKEIGVGIGILAPMGAAAWGMVRNSRSGKAKMLATEINADAARPVVVKPDATGPLADLAADPTVPKVVKAGP